MSYGQARRNEHAGTSELSSLTYLKNIILKLLTRDEEAEKMDVTMMWKKSDQKRVAAKLRASLDVYLSRE